jgi:hypothetical protein
MDQPPKSIICTNTQLLEGAIGALHWSGQNVSLASLGEANWNDNRYPGVEILPRQGSLMGERAGQLLLDNIDNPVFYDTKRILLDNVRVDLDGDISSPAVIRHEKTIQVVLPHDAFTKAITSLLPDLEKHSGVKVKLTEYDYDQLYHDISQNVHASTCDIFLIDIPWLPEFASKGIISDLSGFIEGGDFDIDTLLDYNMLEELTYEDKLYALPHRFTSQLLFYRKDLFEDLKFKRMFYNQYSSELTPPRTWLEYNAIARFFTREFNPESPTKYGCTMGRANPSVIITDFLPRLWASGGDVFDHKGRVVLHSPEAIKALNGYVESLQYTNPAIVEYGWEERAVEFSRVIRDGCGIYGRAPRLSDRGISSVVGKVGFEDIPGAIPVLEMAVLHKRKEQEERGRVRFYTVGVQPRMLDPHNNTGRFSANKHLYSSGQLQQLYPWLNKSLEILRKSKTRRLPKAAENLSIKV